MNNEKKILLCLTKGEAELLKEFISDSLYDSGLRLEEVPELVTLLVNIRNELIAMGTD